MSKPLVVPMEAWDLVEVGKLLGKMAEEEALTYPQPLVDGPAKVQGWLLDQIGNPRFGGFVIRKGFKAKAVMWGLLQHRDDCLPADYLEARILYVAPPFRRKGYAKALTDALLAWGRSMLGPSCVLELSTAPKGSALAMWHRAGMRAVYVRMAWIDEHGDAREGTPLLAPSPRRMESTAAGSV